MGDASWNTVPSDRRYRTIDDIHIDETASLPNKHLAAFIFAYKVFIPASTSQGENSVLKYKS